MTNILPTPTGTAAPTSQLVASPTAWTTQPMTAATETMTVTLVTQKYGSAEGSQFKVWCDAAMKKDPSITPDQASAAFVLGYSLGESGTTILNLLTGGTAVATNPATGQPDVVAQGPGVAGAAATGAESAVRTLEMSNPLAAIAEYIDASYDWLSNRANWVSVVKVGVGSLMILTGINMLIKDTTKIDPMGAVTSVAKVVK